MNMKYQKHSFKLFVLVNSDKEHQTKKYDASVHYNQTPIQVDTMSWPYMSSHVDDVIKLAILRTSCYLLEYPSKL